MKKKKVKSLTDLMNKWGVDSFNESNFINKSGQFDKRLYRKEGKKFLKDIRRIRRYLSHEANLSMYGDNRKSQVINMMNPFYGRFRRLPINKEYMRKIEQKAYGDPKAIIKCIKLNKKLSKLNKKYIH